MKYVVTLSGREIEVEVNTRDDGRFDVLCEGKRDVVDLHSAGGQSLFSVLLGGAAFEVAVVPEEERRRVSLHGRELILTVETEQARRARLVNQGSGTKGPQTVKSVMPGRVVKILVKSGEAVTVGTPLLILEAMKMENEIRSPGSGSVEKILVSEGATVGTGAPLVTFS